MYIFGFLVFILVVVGLFCQYHSQVIGWKDLINEMSCYVSSGILNSDHSLCIENLEEIFYVITDYEILVLSVLRNVLILDFISERNILIVCVFFLLLFVFVFYFLCHNRCAVRVFNAYGNKVIYVFVRT